MAKGDTSDVRQLAAGLWDARTDDDVAATTLRAVAALPGVSRAAIALTVAGGRQLRFVSSDAMSLGPPLPWCLIDAYDRLPLNDAVRTGRHVVVPTHDAFRKAYPELAARQERSGTRSVIALALTAGGRRLGGLLLYRDLELPGLQTPGADLSAMAEEVARALLAVRSRRTAVVAPRAAEEDATTRRPLPGDETAPGLARGFLRETLRGWELDDDAVDAALLCASELVTNVVMHAGQESVISVERDAGAVTVRVRHPTVEAEVPIEPVTGADPLHIAGRGLALVDAVADGWGSETTSGETCVWFRLGA